MQKAKLIRNQRITLEEGRFVVEVRAFEVAKNKKFPQGIKMKCVLIDMELGRPRVLLDNHEPHGFHLHTRLPEDHDFRVSLDILDYEEAIRVFFNEVRKVVSNEK
jgi:hypothetical protein